MRYEVSILTMDFLLPFQMFGNSRNLEVLKTNIKNSFQNFSQKTQFHLRKPTLLFNRSNPNNFHLDISILETKKMNPGKLKKMHQKLNIGDNTAH